jgi:hypothetical protein
VIVVYDASVLYPSTLRDLLIRLAQSGLVTAKWTDRILDEVFGCPVLARPPGTVEDVLASLERGGLSRSVGALRRC